MPATAQQCATHGERRGHQHDIECVPLKAAGLVGPATGCLSDPEAQFFHRQSLFLVGFVKTREVDFHVIGHESRHRNEEGKALGRRVGRGENIDVESFGAPGEVREDQSGTGFAGRDPAHHGIFVEPALHGLPRFPCKATAIHPGDLERRIVIGIDTPQRQAQAVGPTIGDLEPDRLDALLVQGQPCQRHRLSGVGYSRYHANGSFFLADRTIDEACAGRVSR